MPWMKIILIKTWSFVTNLKGMWKRMQGLWTRLFGRVKSHLSSVAQWIVKLLLLVPWKSAHLWRTKTKLHGLSPRTNYSDRAAAVGRRTRKWIYQGSRSGVECHPEVSFGPCFFFWRNSYCPFVPQLALDIHFACHSLTVWEWGISMWTHPNQSCPRDIRSYWLDTFPGRLVMTKRKWRKCWVPPALIWFNRFLTFTCGGIWRMQCVVLYKARTTDGKKLKGHVQPFQYTPWLMFAILSSWGVPKY
jgi:hypothetical protein